jgi:hypothetical protein
LPIRWIANGQEVPEDLETRAIVASPSAKAPAPIDGVAA